MASSNLKTLRIPLITSVEKGHLLPIKKSVMVATKTKTAAVPLQVKCDKEQKPLATKEFAVSRRDMMQCLTAGVLGLTLLPKPAEARMSRREMKKKIMEKLEELREKAGLSKPKTENYGVKKSPTLPLPGGALEPLVEVSVQNSTPQDNVV